MGEKIKIKFEDVINPRRRLGRQDVVATLSHFAIITYAVPVQRVTPYIDSKFKLDSYVNQAGQEVVWVSMVPFEDQDFHFAGLRQFKFKFGQTNYRTYVIERSSGKRMVWFFGTSLDSVTCYIPRWIWNLPWHRGEIKFDCVYDLSVGKYSQYKMKTKSAWASVEIDIEDAGTPVTKLCDWDDLETGLVVLTHPLIGVYRRRDGVLGTYEIWHDRLNCHEGKLKTVRIDLFDRLGLVPFAEQSAPHSVLIQRSTEFTVYLPPKKY